MKVGDFVVAIRSLYIDSNIESTVPVGTEGIVTNIKRGGLVDIKTASGIALGCEIGVHVELHPANGSPLLEALK